MKMHMTARWEIIATAELVTEKYMDRNVPESVQCEIYRGALVPCILKGIIDRKQRWGVTIVTTAKHDDGNIHTHEMSWKCPDTMSFAEFINGSEGMSRNIGSGLRVPWKGIQKMWIDVVDVDLKDCTAITAWATANCLAEVNTRGLSPFSIDKLRKKLNKMNNDALIDQPTQFCVG